MCFAYSPIPAVPAGVPLRKPAFRLSVQRPLWQPEKQEELPDGREYHSRVTGVDLKKITQRIAPPCILVRPKQCEKVRAVEHRMLRHAGKNEDAE
jgi:hypothetical protein